MMSMSHGPGCATCKKKRRSVVFTTSVAVFECHSKACAPPPAGKGGSDPAGAGKVTVRNAVLHIGGTPIMSKIAASGGQLRTTLLATGERISGSTEESLHHSVLSAHNKANGTGPLVGRTSVTRKFLDENEKVPTAAMGMIHRNDEMGIRIQRRMAAKVDWDNVPVTTLPKNAKLYSTESSVATKYIKRVLDGEPLRGGYEPQLIRIGRSNNFIVYDGHHRMAMHAALGNSNESLKVRIAKFPDA